MYCKSCGRKIRKKTEICPYCGADQEEEFTDRRSRRNAYEDEYEYEYERSRKKGHFSVLWIFLILLLAALAFIVFKLVMPFVQGRSGNAGAAAAAQPGETMTLYIMDDGSVVSTTPTPSPSPTPTPVPTPSPTPEAQTGGVVIQGGETAGESQAFPSESTKASIAQADLDVRPDESEYVSSPTVRYIATSSGPLNFRRGPETTYGIIGQIEKGQSVNVYAVKEGWALVEHNGTWGWCSSDYLSETQP